MCEKTQTNKLEKSWNKIDQHCVALFSIEKILIVVSSSESPEVGTRLPISLGFYWAFEQKFTPLLIL